MKNHNFEQYWEDNKKIYMDQAQIDFDRLQSKYSVSVLIDSDDDFRLNIEHSFIEFGKTYQEAIDRVIKTLSIAEFEYVKTWSMTNNNNIKTSGDYSEHWFDIRNEAIQQLRDGEMNISYGGNQNIEINVSEYKPTIKVKNRM